MNRYHVDHVTGYGETTEGGPGTLGQHDEWALTHVTRQG